MTDFASWFKSTAGRVESALAASLPLPETGPAPLLEAMRHSALGGGKRLRGVLTLAACEWACGSDEAALPLAAAVECIHAYSLIHDDLPAMDDADLRRGKPSCHKQFGEAMAILAGDGLQSLAFQLAAGVSNRSAAADIVADLASKAGLDGMVSGQAYDMMYQGTRERLTLDDVQRIHLHKTGALICCTARIGAMVGGADEKRMAAITAFGQALGLGFQIVDDLLDIQSSTEALGKAAGSDADQHKITYPAVMGETAARARAEECVAHARAALQPWGEASRRLLGIADFVLNRKS